MKKLPEPPKIFSPPSEMWFLKHRPAKDKRGGFVLTRSEIGRTYSAMQCALQNATGKPPSKSRMVPMDSVTAELVIECIKRHGDDLIFVWQRMVGQKDCPKSITAMLTRCAKLESESYS